jgi:oligopeptide transport system permease protein
MSELTPQADASAMQALEPVSAAPTTGKPRSLAGDAWEDLRRSWIFWGSVVLITIFMLMAIVPGLFTSVDPTECDLNRSRQAPGPGAVFGYDVQGCDVYARSVYGARASIAVGFLATFLALVLGAVTGVLAGYYGGKVDTVLSRITDVFFALPILLGSIIILTAIPTDEGSSDALIISKVAIAIAVLGWTQTARVARASVIQAKASDYVQAARALGAGDRRIITRHVLPNASSPVIALTTISLGGYIGAEATLSFLGIGLQPPVISWGTSIADAQQYIQVSPHMLFFPSVFLSLTVLAFIMLGVAVTDALNPRLR